jgi:hypothetical protein
VATAEEQFHTIDNSGRKDPHAREQLKNSSTQVKKGF